MQCFSAIQTSTSGLVPCGQCINCRINKGRRWTARLLLENMLPKNPYSRDWFITYTYAPDRIPTTDEGAFSLRKRAFLPWLQRYKARTDSTLRYYAIGEYGDDTFRPHYHSILFNTTLEQARTHCEAWNAKGGFTTISDFTPRRAAYVCAYTTKKLTKATDPRLSKDQEPEFRASSRRPPIAHGAIDILATAWERHRHIIEEHGDVDRTVRINGKQWPLDGYMLKKLRERFDIPLLHRDRILANENYLDYHQTQEAEQCEETALTLETRYHAQKKRNTAITAKV